MYVFVSDFTEKIKAVTASTFFDFLNWTIDHRGALLQFHKYCVEALIFYEYSEGRHWCMPTVVNHIAVVKLINLLQKLGMVFCNVHVSELEIVFMNSLHASLIFKFLGRKLQRKG